MNILFIFERKIIPTSGGVERVTFLLSEEMKTRGHNVFFLSVGPDKWNKEDSFSENQYYIPVNLDQASKKINDFITRQKIDRIILQGVDKNVLKALSVLPPDKKKFLVLHNQPYPSVGKERKVKLLTPWSGLQTKGKILKLLAIISPWTFRVLNNKNNARIYDRILSLTDGLILLSEGFKPRLLKFHPHIDPKKITAINNPNTFTDIEDHVFDLKENIVLFISRLSNPQKNVTGFIDVWKKFNVLNPEWKALIIGDGEHRDIIEKYALKKGVKNLEFLGKREDVSDFYKKAKLLCMTSTYEGWGMVLTEAMAYGCVPIVYNSFEAASDIITHGKSGYLVDPFNVKKMVSSIDKLAKNETLRKEMVTNGIKSIGSFSVDKIVDQWEKLLK